MEEKIVMRGVIGGLSGPEEVPFESFIEPGRQGIDRFILYGLRETGPNGPEASLLRFKPGAHSNRHRHPGHELILVLAGMLEDETDATYPAGTLIVMRPGSIHTVHSSTGCTLLVIREKPVEPVPDVPSETERMKARI